MYTFEEIFTMMYEFLTSVDCYVTIRCLYVIVVSGFIYCITYFLINVYMQYINVIISVPYTMNHSLNQMCEYSDIEDMVLMLFYDDVKMV